MLGMCLCFRDSAAYLEEWLLFHYVQGCRRFYLYNNGSTDEWGTVVRPWVDHGLATVVEYPGLGVQLAMYSDCLARARSDGITWLAFIDDDEFLFATGGQPLPELLKGYGEHAGLAVSWVLFGSGGIEAQESGWVIERFTRSAGYPDPHVKCIVQPQRIVRPRVIGHAFETCAGFSVVDENQRSLTEPLNPAPSALKIRINHYLVKSWMEWRARRARPQADTGKPTPHSEASWREWDQGWSREQDVSAQVFLPAMRSARQDLRLPDSSIKRF